MLIIDKYRFTCACVLNKLAYSGFPSVLCAGISSGNHSSRYCANLKVMHVRTCTRQKSFLCSSVRVWNAIPLRIRLILSLGVFKNELRNWLIHDYKYLVLKILMLFCKLCLCISQLYFVNVYCMHYYCNIITLLLSLCYLHKHRLIGSCIDVCMINK
jgi:hypothetical protein